jgi:hypothetical protein
MSIESTEGRNQAPQSELLSCIALRRIADSRLSIIKLDGFCGSHRLDRPICLPTLLKLSVPLGTPRRKICRRRCIARPARLDKRRRPHQSPHLRLDSDPLGPSRCKLNQRPYASHSMSLPHLSESVSFSYQYSICITTIRMIPIHTESLVVGRTR